MINKILKNVTLRHIVLIIGVTLLSVFLFVRKGDILGFGGDWFLQSVSFYEYFRDLLYKTGDIFPNLALHIGGGQNIFYVAYYGLFSLYWLFFCCFPFIKAGDFFMVTGILNIIVSSILLYVFLQKNDFNKSLSFIGAMILSVSTGMMYFNYTFIMFVQYMPFCILGLIGTKQYLDTNKSSMLVIGVLLLVLNSFYFSISTIICLCLYALYYYMKVNKNLKFKQTILAGLKYISRIVVGILLSGFLLAPVIYVVSIGRTSSISLVELNDFYFNINIGYLMYDSNGLGLSVVVLIAFVYNILFLSKENKYLAIVLLLVLGVPFFNIMLNGFLYENGKVLIPFIPLCIILILNMLNSLKDISYKKIFWVLIVSLVILRYVDIDIYLEPETIFLDLILTFGALFCYKKNNNVIYVFSIVCLIFIRSIGFVIDEKSFMAVEEYNKLYENINIDMSKYINNRTSSIYRTEFDTNDFSVNYSDAKVIYRASLYSSTYNKTYRNVLTDTFHNSIKSANVLVTKIQENLFINKFMGIRYLISSLDAPYGYKLIYEYDNGLRLYENDNVNAIGFATSSLLNYDEYNKLSRIDKLLSTYNNVIVDAESKNEDFIYAYRKIETDSFKVKSQEGVSILENNGIYSITSGVNGNVYFIVDERIRDKILLIRFNVDNQYSCDLGMFDQSISINGVRNSTNCNYWPYYNNNTSFDYVISSNDMLEEINVSFANGVYKIYGLEIYAIDKSVFDKNKTVPMEIDFDKTTGDVIEGNINVFEDGYFVFSIPYDNGYKAYVDDIEVDIEEVSNGFIGFKINEGNHKIRLTFEAPFANLGLGVTFGGIIIFGILNFYERKKGK